AIVENTELESGDIPLDDRVADRGAEVRGDVAVASGDHDSSAAFSNVGLQHYRVRQIMLGQEVLHGPEPGLRGEILAQQRKLRHLRKVTQDGGLRLADEAS